ncbi:MAG: putative rane protein [Bryobacterales bacterium]|nr:putative rane protein [Bryobacterales bacterium]
MIETAPVMHTDFQAPRERQYKYLDLLILTFVVILLISNLIAAKFTYIGPLPVSAALLLFPITYIFGDIFTEVYGYGASRKAIWRGFYASILMAVMGLFAVWLPPAPEWKDQKAYETIFNAVPRIVAGSLLAYWFGEFANSYTLAKLKILTKGKHLWTRTVSSTVVGQGVDTIIVTCFIFYNKPLSFIAKLILSGYLFKVVYEVLATPVTYIVVNFLKRQEGIDVFDRGTDFNPFKH